MNTFPVPPGHAGPAACGRVVHKRHAALRPSNVLSSGMKLRALVEELGEIVDPLLRSLAALPVGTLDAFCRSVFIAPRLRDLQPLQKCVRHARAGWCKAPRVGTRLGQNCLMPRISAFGDAGSPSQPRDISFHPSSGSAPRLPGTPSKSSAYPCRNARKSPNRRTRFRGPYPPRPSPDALVQIKKILFHATAC